MKRLFDLLLLILLLPFLLPVALLVAVAVKATSKEPAIFWSERVGRDCNNFQMAKFRTMKVETPQLATHLLTDSAKFLTPIGSFLRKTSLDELPQLWNVLKGDMSFVGPRPALFNQDDLIALREKYSINTLTPGITGWAQINGRDDIAIPLKVELEKYYYEHRSIRLDIKILWLTGISVITGKDVSH